jgi:hypothetical protein
MDHGPAVAVHGDMRTAWVLVATVVASTAATRSARADDGYVGGTAGLGCAGGPDHNMDCAWEVGIDAGTPIGGRPWLYARGKLGAGMAAWLDDGLTFVGASGGVEVRSPGRHVRAVAGLDVGVLVVDASGFEADHDRLGPVMPALSARAGGELWIDRTIVRLGISTFFTIPMLTAGVAMRF